MLVQSPEVGAGAVSDSNLPLFEQLHFSWLQVDAMGHHCLVSTADQASQSTARVAGTYFIYLVSQQTTPFKDGCTVLVIWKQTQGVLHLWFLLTDVALNMDVQIPGHGSQTIQQCFRTSGSKARRDDRLN